MPAGCSSDLWQVAGIYSAIVLATGPTVVSPLVEQIKLASPLSEVLKAEGLLLEPIGAVLALLLLELTLGDLRGINDVFIALMQRLGGGVLIGLSAGWLLSEILKKIKNEASFGIELQVTLYRASSYPWIYFPCVWNLRILFARIRLASFCRCRFYCR